MRSEVVFVQAVGADVDAAISLLTSGRPLPRQVVDNRIWSAVTVPPSSGRLIAAALGQALDRMAFLLTIGPDEGTLTLFTRDSHAVGPVDGRDSRAVADLLRPWRFMRPDAVAAALSSRAEPADRIRQVAAAMRLPDPGAPPDEEPAGVVVVEQSPGALRARLQAGRQGAILVPLGQLTALVADGSGLGADPVGLAESVATSASPERAVLVSWGPSLAIETWGGPDDAPPLARREPTTTAAGAKAVLTGFGLADVPVGASPEALATWASTRPGAIRTSPAADGRPAVLPVTDPEVVRAAVRRMRRLRRAQQALGVGAVAAGVGVAILWDEIGGNENVLPWFGVLTALLLVCLVLAAVVGRRRRKGTMLPARPRRRVPAGQNPVERPQLPH